MQGTIKAHGCVGRNATVEYTVEYKGYTLTLTGATIETAQYNQETGAPTFESRNVITCNIPIRSHGLTDWLDARHWRIADLLLELDREIHDLATTELIHNIAGSSAIQF